MKAFFIGCLMIAGGLYLGSPADWSVGWFPAVLEVLKGLTPIALLGLGLLSVLLGIADMRDRAEARKEEGDKR